MTITVASTSDDRSVDIAVRVYVKRAGIYAADIRITAIKDWTTVYEDTHLYPRRQSYKGVERSAWRLARRWCEDNGYSEIIEEGDSVDD